MTYPKTLLATLATLASLWFVQESYAREIDPDTLATIKERFAKADVNGDGKLSRDECESGMPRIYRGFDEIDADKNGSITLDQIIEFVKNH